MKYPRGFPAYLKPRVEAAIVKAQHQLPSQWEMQERIKQEMLAVIEITIEAVRKGDWNPESAHSGLEPFLHFLCANDGYLNRYLNWSDFDKITTDIKREVTTSLAWLSCLEELAVLAEGQAKRSEVVQSLGIPVRNAPDQQRPTGTRPLTIGGKARQQQHGSRNKWDAFISHASEDKDAIARPLAQALQARGLRVWYDEFSLTVGDSLRESIDQGLAHSEFGVVILSTHFFEKHWPTQELNGLATREVNGKKVILPVWHEVSFEDVRQYSPTLADRVAVTTEKGVGHVVEQLLGAMK